MKTKTCLLIWLAFLGMVPLARAQNTEDAAVIKTVLLRYYKTEKPVYKGRSQLLYLYCNRANNNEELVEAIQSTKLPADFKTEIRQKITDTKELDWHNELEAIYKTDQTKLQQKISECLSLEKYHEVSKRLHLNNQRLMIISKPLYYSKSNIALVKVTFYRNIEHNNGSVLLLEKVDGQWIIKDYLNTWAT
ncbi:hypothetical protein [Flavobacterium sp.]|uniref:hypothetical protein n=1 Tax=Flavobacterium sp. TaxID=239 RepID=UPI0039E37655